MAKDEELIDISSKQVLQNVQRPYLSLSQVLADWFGMIGGKSIVFSRRSGSLTGHTTATCSAILCAVQTVQT